MTTELSLLFGILIVAVLAACSAAYFLLQRKLQREIAEIRERVESALPAIPPAVTNGSKKVDTAAAADSKPTKAVEAKQPTPKPVAVPQPQQTAEELAHETLVVIAAAVSAFLGKSVRLRSARLIHPSEGNAWAQQGRVFVQASHNLARI